jgi:hypothetical protein
VKLPSSNFADSPITGISAGGRQARSRIIPFVPPLIFFLVECYRYIRLRDLPESALIQYVPDDAFYYLVLGRNFSRSHRWTLDGVASATGFHLLWGYFIALIYRLLPGLTFHQIFTALFFAGSFFTGLALALTSVVVKRRVGHFALLGPAAIFFSYWSLNQPNLLMESSLVLFFTSLCWYLILGREKAPSTRVISLAFIAGFLGMMSRSDFGLFLLGIVVLLAFEPLFDRFFPSASKTTSSGPSRARRSCTASMFAGSVLGLIVIVSHTYIVSGHLIQGSAREKRLWSELRGDRTKTSTIFALTVMRSDEATEEQDPTLTTLRTLETLLFISLAAVSVAGPRGSRPFGLAGMTAVSIFTIVSYILLYKYDCAAIGPWYYANFLIPFSLITAVAISSTSIVWRFACLIAVCCNLYYSAHTLLNPPWPSQIGLYEAGTFIRRHPELKPVGAWNAGLESFFADGGLVNLDGLVNDDIFHHSLAGTLPRYLLQRGIRHIADDDIMLRDSYLRQRGGYPSTSLTRCIQSQTRIAWSPVFTNAGDQVALSSLNTDCLADISQVPSTLSR